MAGRFLIQLQQASGGIEPISMARTWYVTCATYITNFTKASGRIEPNSDAGSAVPTAQRAGHARARWARTARWARSRSSSALTPRRRSAQDAHGIFISQLLEIDNADERERLQVGDVTAMQSPCNRHVTGM